MANSNTEKLKNYFNIKTKTANNVVTIQPLTKDPTNPDKPGQPVKYNTEIEKLFNFYINKCVLTQEDVKRRENRNRLLKQMYTENTIIFLAVEMLADESIAVQDNTSFITVKSKSPKLTKKINDLLNQWNINQTTAKNIFLSLYLYGDSFRFRKLDNDKGILGFNFLDVDDIKKRYEFNPLKMNDIADSQIALASISNSYKSIQDLFKSIDNKEYDNLGTMLDSILLGWELSMGIMLPPWLISHTRLYSSESEFFPYGRSMFINSLSAFLQLKASKNLMIMARANNFPYEVWEIKVGDNQSETEQWNALNRFVQNLNNMTSTQSLAEQKGIKSTIYSIKDSATFKIEKPDFDLNQIADIEMLELDLLRPTGIPLDLILGRTGSGFSSGKLLSTQSVYFSKKISAGKTAFLEGLIEDIKLHLYMTNDVDKDTDFELEMLSPQSEETEEYFSSRKNNLDLISSIIDSAKKACGIDVDIELPKEIVKSIFRQYSFLDIKEIDMLIDGMYDAKDKAVDILGDEEDFFNANNEIKPEPQAPAFTPNKAEPKEENVKFSFKKKFTESDMNKLKRLNKTVINESYFQAKHELNLTEGYLGGKYYMTSNYNSDKINETIKSIKSHLEKDFKTKGKTRV